jgi:hypothetical protein
MTPGRPGNPIAETNKPPGVSIMNPDRNRRFLFCLVVLLALGLAGGALADNASGPEPENSEVSESSPIMNQPLDGSSPEALTANLEKIRKEASEKDYTRLRNALGKMRMYDLSINHDSAKLAAAVNGKTPEEVIEASTGLWR